MPHASFTFGSWAAMAYMAVVPMGFYYLSWFPALRRLPAATASMAALLSPPVGVVLTALALGEPIRTREGLALGSTLSGVALALRKT
jgi:drug/metabolite transporter (DMT)-like permease